MSTRTVDPDATPRRLPRRGSAAKVGLEQGEPTMLIALVAAFVLAQAAAEPQPAAPQAAPAAQAAPAKPEQPAKPAKPKLICHDESDTGSFISKRVCRTKEQIDAEAQQSQREHNALSDHLAACRGQPSC